MEIKLKQTTRVDNNVHFPFYPNNWIGSDELKLCSPATQGFWINCLARMWFSPKRGYLLKANSNEYSIEELAKVTGFSQEIIQNSIKELIDNRVCEVKGQTVLISRFMVRLWGMISSKKLAGAKGGANKFANTKKRNHALAECDNDNDNDNDIYNKKRNNKKIKEDNSNRGGSVREGGGKDYPYNEIIQDFNEVTGARLHAIKSIKEIINALYLENPKLTLEDFKHVHRVKFQEWNGTKWEKYIRPSTLYSQVHFPEYRNQFEIKKTDATKVEIMEPDKKWTLVINDGLDCQYCKQHGHNAKREQDCLNYEKSI